MFQVGLQQAESREQTCRRGHDDAAYLERARELDGEQRPVTPESQQGKLARVAAAVGRNSLDGAHQASDALARDALFPRTQVGVDARRTVGASAPFVNSPDLLGQRGASQRTMRGLSMPPGVEAAGRHLEYPTELSDRVLGLLH